MNAMITRRLRLALSAALALGASFAWAAPASAASSTIHYSYTDPVLSEVLPCGALWTYGGEHDGTIVKADGQGGFARIVQHDSYPGTITFAGRTYTTNDRQTDITTVALDGRPIGTLNGQGLFTHLPRIGVVVSDTGHLVFDETTHATLRASAHVIPLDQDFDFGAAVCAALTGQ